MKRTSSVKYAKKDFQLKIINTNMLLVFMEKKNFLFVICIVNSSCDETDFVHTLQMNFFSSPWTRLICWSWYFLVWNLFSHISHLNFFSTASSILSKFDSDFFNYLAKWLASKSSTCKLEMNFFSSTRRQKW